MSRNQIVLSGVVRNLQPIRHSPAGVPVLMFELEHQSRQAESDTARNVSVTMRVQAAGDLAQEIGRFSEGAEIVVKGFLTRSSQRSDIPVLHVNGYKLLREVNHGTTH
ncbi:MAG: primosomal replication protein N [Burkholderiales bacterium]